MGNQKVLGVVKYVLLVIALLYIAGIVCIPAMKPLASNWVAWLVFIIYALNLLFVWVISGKRQAGDSQANRESSKEASISAELLRDRNKWVS